MTAESDNTLNERLDKAEEQLIWDRLDGFVRHSGYNPSAEIPIIKWGNSDRAIILSDLHMGDGGPADDYDKNHLLVCDTINRFKGNRYKTFCAGDHLEGWQFDFGDIDYREPKFDYEIQGNHDRALGLYPEAILLKSKTDSILIDHGYAGEVTTDIGWKAARWFIRHVWTPIESAGLAHDPYTDPRPSVNPERHFLVVQARKRWAWEREQVLCFGHTHSAFEDRPYIFNSGSCVGVDGITALIIEGFDVHAEYFKR